MLLASLSIVALVPQNAHSLWAFALALWCMAVLGASLVMLGAWRIGGRAYPARLGTGLALAATLIPLIPLAVEASLPKAHHVSAKALALTVVFSVAGALVAGSALGPQIETALRPLRRLASMAAVTILIGVGVVAAFVALAAPSGLLVRLLPAAVCLGYAGWLFVAGARARPAPPFRGALPLSLALLASAFAVRGSAASGVAHVVVATCLSTSGGLLVGIAAEFLRAALRRQDVRSLTTMASIAEFQTAAERDRERRHDALSALAAIRSASSVLASSGAELDSGTRVELIEAVRAELARVERILALSDSTAHRASGVDVADALSPLLRTWRQRGLVVEDPADDVLVHVDPDVLVQIVNNLLHNAHRHAPGSTVRLMVDEAADSVHLSIIDDGPGIPAPRRAEVFEPGVRLNREAAGSGLGLPSARRLADSQRGELRLLDVDDGCWFVLSLPRAQVRVLDGNRTRSAMPDD